MSWPAAPTLTGTVIKLGSLCQGGSPRVTTYQELGECFFFFQAEDGIRDLTVTGVQTCALPIFCTRNLLDLRVLDKNGASTDSAVIAAIQQAVQLKSKYNVRVINLSLGRPIYES